MENLIIEQLKKQAEESNNAALAHKQLRESDDYKEELQFLRKMILDFTNTLRLCQITASRWVDFHEKYLLPQHFDDLAEAALTAQLAIENGALNPARRELRYMLEVAVNIAYVDEEMSGSPLPERRDFYKSKQVKKINVDQVSKLPFRLLGENKESFSQHVKNAWVRSSNYVHLTKRQMDQKLELRERGITLGMETVAMLQEVVSEVHEVCSIVSVLAFETIGPSFTGDMFVDNLDSIDHWALHASGYIALVDSYFDYKHERKERLDVIHETRTSRIKYPVV
ncbi:hypothetical protein CWN85_11180 [Vibrio splendidus]|uniref:hypothetical protein n=1 Tax=Vibrio TaxID=662 RepID=UPI000D3C5564|nr:MULTISPECIES: hypothetical protein [Vibrio]PTP08771.1 hypothetical protein CWN86_08035 [Vibrio splendidus]PTP23622.1 hypothetical protein CWN85_11180 [Vibrio splendidus]RLQ17142.1 hypothetical protein AYK60_18720 [Vibrio sp. SBT000027]